MHNLEVVRSFRIKANFTGEDWDLYTDDMDCSYAVRELNDQLQQSCAIHTDRSETEREMESVMDRLSQYGAGDTEARAHLRNVLDFIYGRN